MKIGLSMYSVVNAVRSGQIDLRGFIDYAARQDVQGIELLDVFWTEEAREVPPARRQAAAAGLALPVYSISNNFVQTDAAARAAQGAALRRGVDTAVALGAGLLRVFSGDLRPGLDFETAFPWVTEGLAAGAEYARARGITLVLENHGQLAGRSEQLRAILATVDSPALRLNFDTGNFLIAGEEPLLALDALLDDVALVHLKDLRHATDTGRGQIFAGSDGARFTGAAIGEGLVPLAGILRRLAQGGYSGWLSLEYEGNADPLKIGVPRSLAALRALLEEP